MIGFAVCLHAALGVDASVVGDSAGHVHPNSTWLCSLQGLLVLYVQSTTLGQVTTLAVGVVKE